MNRLLLVLLFVSSSAFAACGMSHMGRLDGADGATEDGSQADGALMLADGADAADSSDAIDETDAPVDVVIVLDTGTGDGPDAGQDAGTDAGTDTGTDTAPDVFVNPTCPFGYEYCGGDCVIPNRDPSMCGTTCSSQVCSTNQSCDHNLENHWLCCTPVLVIPGGTMVGHCPEGSCPTGRCYSTVTGFSDITWYCCPAAP